MIAEGREGPFESNIILLFVFILHKLVILLVDWVISEMHILVIFIEFSRVWLRCKPRKSFFENIDPQRFIWSDDHIDSQVELVSIYK